MAEKLYEKEKSSESPKEPDDRKKKQADSDKLLAELKKEIEEKAKERLVSSEDDYKSVSEKLNKSRDRFVKANDAAVAADPEDPNLESFRDLRTKSYGEYKLIFDELNRRTAADLN